MREAAQDWFKRAELDLAACHRLVAVAELRSIVAFHAQQSIEKLFKCLLEEKQLPVPRTHDLLKLYRQVSQHLAIDVDVRVLEELSTVYLDSRYPSDLGMMPQGQPSNDDVKRFLVTAEDLYTRIKEH